MRNLHYADDAKANLVNIAIYVANQSGSREIAVSFVERLRGQCRKLATLPGTLGRLRPELHLDLRSFPFLGYVIFFRYFDQTFEVVNILNGSRDIEAYFDEGI